MTHDAAPPNGPPARAASRLMIPAVGLIAVSLAGLRPGISVGAETINIRPDALFWLSACRNLNGLTRGFNGTLDATGAGSASIFLPPAIPAGLPITIAAVAVNPGKPGGLDLTRSVTVFPR